MANPGFIQKIKVSNDGYEVTSFLLPSMTTTERDNLSAVNGMIIYNSTTATVQVYQGGAWASV